MGLTVILGTLTFVDASHGGHQKVEDIVSHTKEVIQNLRAEADSAEQTFNATDMEASLDLIGKEEEGSFDVAGYSKKQKEFAALAKTAREKAALANEFPNGATRTDMLNASKAAEHDMEATGVELTQMEANFSDKLRRALDEKLKPAEKAAKEFERNASHQAHAAHKIMDPLYGMGDNAEDQADRLNDGINDAYSKIAKVVRSYRQSTAKHARAIQRQIERKLFVAPTAEQRLVMEREVRRTVNQASSQAPWRLSLAASWHANVVTSFVGAAAAGAFITSMSLVVKKNWRTAREDDFLLLEP